MRQRGAPGIPGAEGFRVPAPDKASPASVGIAAGLSILALLLWAMQLTLLNDLRASDAAGNALAQAYCAIAIILLWVLLAVLNLIAFFKGAMPVPVAIAALILIPVSGDAALSALELLRTPELAPFRWPIIIPALTPPIIITFTFWALLPGIHVRVPAIYAGTVAWGSVLLLCIALVPFQQMRGAVGDQMEAARAKAAADFAKLTPNSPLWEWVPFLAVPDQTLVSSALDRIRHLKRRQNDTELMLERGDFPLGQLGAFDLTPTPALCEKARNLLRQRAGALTLKEPESRPFKDIAVGVSDAVSAMTWLIDYDCSCAPEAQIWETTVKAYREPGYDLYRLAELRDPKRLGRALYEDPERFSMLTPRAHLKAWLKFADEKSLREQVLAGARKLDHRTVDAVEILNKDESGARVLLESMPVLDLEPTPELCGAALGNLHKQFGGIYRPKADDPRSYQELLGRLGRGEQFIALRWLASHGCDADAELSQAESLIGAYQPSPDGGLILGQLERLHRKP
jgi:hypothetical protein